MLVNTASEAALVTQAPDIGKRSIVNRFSDGKFYDTEELSSDWKIFERR